MGWGSLIAGVTGSLLGGLSSSDAAADASAAQVEAQTRALDIQEAAAAQAAKMSAASANLMEQSLADPSSLIKNL